jgi:hypothetical protein
MLIGASVGSAIGEGIVNSAENFKPEFTNLFSDIFTSATTKAKDLEGLKPEERAQKEAFDYIQGITGNAGLGASMLGPKQQIANIAGKLTYGESFEGLTKEQVLLFDLGLKKQFGTITEDEYNKAIELLQEANKNRAKNNNKNQH